MPVQADEEEDLHRARVLEHAAAPLLFSVCGTRVELLEKSYLNITGADPVSMELRRQAGLVLAPLQTVLINKAQGCIP